jgi:signal transduction histidine kinase
MLQEFEAKDILQKQPSRAIFFMPEKIENLKKIAAAISSAATPAQQIQLLTQGFELFSEETERLDEAYAILREQFSAVNKKLEETHERLENKVQELHVLTGYLDNILSHMAQGLIFVDLEGNVTTYNKAAEVILELTRDQILFQAYQEHFPDHLFGFSMEQALKNRLAPQTTFATVDLPEGRQKELEIVNTFILKEENSAQELDFTQGLIVLLRDITELRHLQMLTSRNDRMKALGEMAAQVAHEIRNPLGGIKGFASLLQRDLKDSPQMLKLAHAVVEGADTLDRLVTQVLNYSRPAHLKLELVPLGTLMEKLTNSLSVEKAYDENRIDLQLKIQKELVCPVDSGLLQSALRNLLINAIQAISGKGKIVLSLNESAGKAEIQIQDTGVGIPHEHLKKLFTPFFTTKANGNGFGLAEANKVIQAHGGEITVNSIQGKGCTISIKLPLRV